MNHIRFHDFFSSENRCRRPYLGLALDYGRVICMICIDSVQISHFSARILCIIVLLFIIHNTCWHEFKRYLINPFKTHLIAFILKFATFWVPTSTHLRHYFIWFKQFWDALLSPINIIIWTFEDHNFSYKILTFFLFSLIQS